MTDQLSSLYAGLAGETGPGRVVDSGLFRLVDGDQEWQALQRGLPERPAVRALAVHPTNPAVIYAGTQSGPYRSADRGEHWEKVELPDHGLPVWSILFHPHDPDVILVGCENCEAVKLCHSFWSARSVTSSRDCETVRLCNCATVSELISGGLVRSA